LKAHLDQSYLDVEDLAPILLGIAPDDNAVWRAMGRLGDEYVSSLARRVAEECLGLWKAAFPVYVADSTGLGVPYRTGVQGPRVKLHTLTLLPSNVVLASSVTLGSRHDSPVLRELLEGVWGTGLVLADSAYFSGGNVVRCLGRGLVLVVKPRKGLRDPFLLRYAGFFRAAWRAYRYRGVAEGVYGAMENRFGCRLRSRGPEAQATEGLLQVYVHNLLALFKAQEASLILLAWFSLSTMASTEDLWDNPRLFNKFPASVSSWMYDVAKLPY
jgi:hypothetical protein